MSEISTLNRRVGGNIEGSSSEVTGRIHNNARVVRNELSGTARIDGKAHNRRIIISGSIIGTSGGSAIEYAGPYEVTPIVEDSIVLNTQNKYMRGNVTVHKIPYYETSNEQGKTAYIGVV